MRHDTEVLDYRDFAENLGKYRPGISAIPVYKKNGELDNYLPFSMPDFGAVSSSGYATLVASSYVASVRHNTGYKSVSFGNGAKYATSYRLINRNNISDPNTDFHLPRLNKVITDGAVVQAVEKSEIRRNDRTRYSQYARVGAGRQYVVNDEQTEEVQIAAAYQWKSGGTIPEAAVTLPSGTLRWQNYGPDDARSAPLSSAVHSGDSGSPIYVYDEQDRAWKIVGVMHAMLSNNGIYQRVSAAEYIPDGYIAEILARNVSPDVTDSLAGGPISWGNNAISQRGTSWSWQGLDASYRSVAPSMATDEELDASKDLRFNGEGGEIVLSDAVNMGAGKLQFSNSYTLRPAAGSGATWAGGGVEVDGGKKVLWQVNGLANDALHKIGEGTLHIHAEGINRGSLNVGDGVVILDQIPDEEGRKQAFESVTLVSGRPSVILGSADQVSSEKINFGYRGGELDLNGNSLTFKNINHTDSGARIVNHNLHAAAAVVLTGLQAGAKDIFRGFLGESVADKPNGELNAIYKPADDAALFALTGGMNLNGNLSVERGTMLLSGQPVPHAGKTVIADDWLSASFTAKEIVVKDRAALHVGEYASVRANIVAEAASQVVLGYNGSGEESSRLWRCYAVINGNNTCSKPQRSDEEQSLLPASEVRGDITLHEGASLWLGKVDYAGTMTALGESRVMMGSTAAWRMTGSSKLRDLQMIEGATLSMLPENSGAWQAKMLSLVSLNASGMTLKLGIDPRSALGDRLTIEKIARGANNKLSVTAMLNQDSTLIPGQEIVLIDAPAGTAHDYFSLPALARGFTLYTPDYQVIESDSRVRWVIKSQEAAKPEPEPAPQPEPQPQPEPKPEPKPEPQPQPEPMPEPQLQPELKPDPHPEAEPAPEPAPKPQPAPQPEAEPQPEPQPDVWFKSEDNLPLQNRTRALMATRQYLFSESASLLNDRAKTLRANPQSAGAWAVIAQSRGKFHDVKVTDSTLRVGADTNINRQFFGLEAGFTQGSAKGHGVEQHRMASVGMYYSWSARQGWFVDAAARYMRLMQEIAPESSLGIARAKPNSDMVAASLKAGNQFVLSSPLLTVTPYLEMGGGSMSGYSLSGKDASISLSSASPFFVSPGVELKKNLDESEGGLALTAGMAWQYMPGRAGSSLSLADTHAVRRSEAWSDNRYRAHLGIEGKVSPRWSMNARAEHSFGGSFSSDVNLAAGVNYHF
jgi:serine protease autotransporter